MEQQFLYDGLAIASEFGSSWTTANARYVHGPGIDTPIIRVNQAGERAYFHQDGLGNVVAVTDQTSQSQSTSRYDAWGNIERQTGELSQYGYTGREPDGTGLLYMRARYYDPAIGRFTQRDPIGFAGGINLYAYALGNPTNLTDSLGTTPSSPTNASNQGYTSSGGGGTGLGGQANRVVGGLASSEGGENFTVLTSLRAPGSSPAPEDVATFTAGGPASVGVAGIGKLFGNLFQKVKNFFGFGVKGAIGLTDNAANLALSNIGRVDHAGHNLIKAGVIPGNPGSNTARQAFRDLGQNILTNPTRTFDHVMRRGGQSVTGFLGQTNGQNVIIFVAKEVRGKIGVGDIVTAIKPSAQQLLNFGIRK